MTGPEILFEAFDSARRPILRIGRPENGNPRLVLTGEKASPSVRELLQRSMICAQPSGPAIRAGAWQKVIFDFVPSSHTGPSARQFVEVQATPSNAELLVS